MTDRTDEWLDEEVCENVEKILECPPVVNGSEYKDVELLVSFAREALKDLRRLDWLNHYGEEALSAVRGWLNNEAGEEDDLRDGIDEMRKRWGEKHWEGKR